MSKTLKVNLGVFLYREEVQVIPFRNIKQLFCLTSTQLSPKARNLKWDYFIFLKGISFTNFNLQ